ncbi:hypothetical protein WJX72_011755 [[Myrmecia] bisecta]|uniref:RecA family profile 1 domain-containing protein n=1 Tax=[Myrmecia] bisecta TaxID=41462 RepID=A0AAW1P2N1_9CHLO
MDELARFIQPDETAAAFLARSFVEPLRTGLFFLDASFALRPGHVVELSGPSGCAKTELLAQAAAACVLPAQAYGVSFGGREENVLVFDLDAKFDTLRLMQVLTTRMRDAQAAQGRSLPEAAGQQVLEACLSRLHVVTCHSSFELLAALKVIKPTMTRLEAAGGIRLLLIDNVSAFYWLDRGLRGPMGNSAAIPGGHDMLREGAPLALHRVHAALAAELRKLLRNHRLSILATKHAMLGSSNREEGMWAYREFLPKPWQELVTHRVQLRAAPPPPPGGQPASPLLHFLARWQAQPDVIHHFAVTDGMILKQ